MRAHAHVHVSIIIKKAMLRNFKPDYVCYFDGACTPKNPDGDMGSGSVVIDNHTGKIIFELAMFYPRSDYEKTTNNIAEYLGLIHVLDFFIKNKITRKRILINGDSMLVAKQMSGSWGIHEGAYKEYALMAKQQAKHLRSELHNKMISWWIPREQNAYADKLSKQIKSEETYS